MLNITCITSAELFKSKVHINVVILFYNQADLKQTGQSLVQNVIFYNVNPSYNVHLY